MKYTIEQLLIAASPRTTYNQAFVHATMTAIIQTDAAKNAPRQKLVSRQTLLMKFAHLPRYAVIAIAICTLLAISGSAYAAYRLWLQPKAKTIQTSTNQFGRQETLLALQNCSTNPTNYELKSQSNTKSQEVAAIVQATCELQAIRQWAESKWADDNQYTELIVQGPYHINKHTNPVYEVFDLSVHESIKFATETSTLYIAEGRQTNVDAIKNGQTIMKLTRATYGPNLGAPISQEVLAVIRLGLPGIYYTPEKQNSIASRQSCLGNMQESCVQAASIDIYLQTQAPESQHTAEIQGTLVDHKGTNFTIQASSGQRYTLNMSSDILTNFKHPRAKVATGDMISVHYDAQSPASTTINQDQIKSIQLLLELTNKQDSLKKY